MAQTEERLPRVTYYEPSERDDLENRFTYHPPISTGLAAGPQQARYEALREEAKELAERICRYCPPSRERSLALTKLEESVFWANAAIARNEWTE